NGAWARERHLHRAALHPGQQGVCSRSGGSSHVHNPLLVLQRSGGTEEFGACYAANLVYSGNFNATAEVSPMDTTRVVMGVDSDTCSFVLSVGEHLALPELVLFYAENGTGALTRGLHDLYRKHLVRENPFKQRPVLINNWEATYFDFNEQKLEQIMQSAAKVGVDLFVLDDGWFGHRDDDTTSLGDWCVNTHKLPNGMEGLCAVAGANGMKLGLWFEPECISEDSALYRAHPDFCIHIENRTRTRSRHQLLADITRPEVRD
ncbi:MAG: alpha-galactosidase, partial [Ruthenibacterium sp.]